MSRKNKSRNKFRNKSPINRLRPLAGLVAAAYNAVFSHLTCFCDNVFSAIDINDAIFKPKFLHDSRKFSSDNRFTHCHILIHFDRHDIHHNLISIRR